ncbi:retrovirus-related Pol polyprotein from transposon 412 [Trichonephila clavipes]|nr:retrovirus-related Pol polyprotein from transposon 412 [Trichonephila clavipes]
MHSTLKRILRVLCLEAIPDWEKIVPQALFALRTVIHDSTEFSPAELVHGKNLRTPVMLLYEKLTEEPVESNLAEHDIELESEREIDAKSPRQIEILKSEVNNVLELKIIEPGEFDFTFPLILVQAPGKENNIKMLIV